MSTVEHRVTIVMPSASPTGGAEEAFTQLLKSDAAKKVHWQAIFLEDGPLVEQIKTFVEQSLVVKCGRTREIWKWWTASEEISRLASEFQSNLILGWMTKGHVYGGLAAWRAGIPAVWFQMGLPENGLLDQVSRWLPARVVFTCSEFVADQQRAKQPASTVVAIPLGVDLSRFDLEKLPTPAESRQRLGLPEAGAIIGIVGRLQRWKGMHTLIAAMPAILKYHPDAHCLVVGGAYPAEPEYENELHLQARMLNIDLHVTFAGFQPNVPLWMQAMDVFVHASNREPFGIVVVEAMALGKSVVGCTPGGPAEIIEHGINGWHHEFENSNQLAARLAHLLDHPPIIPIDAAVQRAKSFSQDRFSCTVVDEIGRNCTQ